MVKLIVYCNKNTIHYWNWFYKKEGKNRLVKWFTDDHRVDHEQYLFPVRDSRAKRTHERAQNRLLRGHVKRAWWPTSVVKRSRRLFRKERETAPSLIAVDLFSYCIDRMPRNILKNDEEVQKYIGISLRQNLFQYLCSTADGGTNSSSQKSGRWSNDRTKCDLWAARVFWVLDARKVKKSVEMAAAKWMLWKHWKWWGCKHKTRQKDDEKNSYEERIVRWDKRTWTQLAFEINKI